ncbi:hypothetical protein H0H92_007715 [Tricholoma furcatifolium]|nr:hypothetical protein H0H92_007715 [Tricholoma furcatifolium]
MSKGTKDTPSDAGSSRLGGPSAPPPYQAAQHQLPPQIILLPTVTRQSPRQRFCSALFIALVVWFLVTALVQNQLQRVPKGDFPVPLDVNLAHCAVGEEDWSYTPFPSLVDGPFWNKFPYSSSTEFELPLSYETLFLLARGSQTQGRVNVITSNEVSDVVKVHVTVNYASKDIRDNAIKVCLLKQDQNAIGVGYFTRPWYRWPSVQSAYEMTVVIPASEDPHVRRHIQNFKTDMNNAKHWLGDLQDSVTFSRISIKGSNAAIQAHSIFADTAVFRTSNGAITGSYNSSRSLTLRTSNAPIEVDIVVSNEKGYVSDLAMNTSNGKIKSQVSLTSASENASASENGRYMVTAATSNSALDVAFLSSPLASTLKVSAATSNGPALLAVPPAYEGQFSMTTSNGSPSIRRRDIQDPSGRGRARNVRTTSLGRNTLRGSVSWSNEEGPGRIDLRTSNSPVVVEI